MSRNLDDASRAHLLRRFCFEETPEQLRSLRGLDGEAAMARIWKAEQGAPEPTFPAFLAPHWRNAALAYQDLSVDERNRRREAQLREAESHISRLRESWITRLASGTYPLRENLLLFLHGLFGSASAEVEVPQALHQRNVLMWRFSMGTYPDLLESLIVDPAMMIQTGMEGHSFDRVSDRPAKLVLEHWTTGPDGYRDPDVEELSRALTGWSLGSGTEDPASQALDPMAARAARRTGILARFDAEAFDGEPKTLLGTTANFDARSAVRHLALHPATAQHFSAQLLRHLGVHDPGRRLQGRLAQIYLQSRGALRPLLAAIATSAEFFSEDSRYALIKSPAHLFAGACRQLRPRAVVAGAADAWMISCGQKLFDTPNNGEGGWPGQESWLSPPDRLARRYGLARVLGADESAGARISTPQYQMA